MKWKLVYFDDQVSNIDCFEEILNDDFRIIGCSNVSSFEQILLEQKPHALLLDVHMPEIDGFSLCRSILASPNYNGCPIFFISGDIDGENIISSFEHGAVDFLPRDLQGEEINVRLSNKIKLYLERAAKLEIGNLLVNVGELKALLNSEPVDLTLIEMRILCLVMRAFPHSISREDIIKKIWGSEPIKPGTINTHVTNIKIKLDKWTYSMRIKDGNVSVVRD